MNISSKYFLFIRLIKYLINEYHLKVFQVNKNHQKQYLTISFYLSNHTQKLFYKSLLTKKHIFKQGHTYWREKYISQAKKKKTYQWTVRKNSCWLLNRVTIFLPYIFSITLTDRFTS